MQELLQTYSPKIFKVGEIVEGIVVKKTPKSVLLDIGGKSEGIIFNKDILENLGSINKIEVKDRVFALVVKSENDQGLVLLSLRRDNKEKTWREIIEKQEKNEIFEVNVVDFNKGGLLVDYQGILGFVPFSLLSRENFLLAHEAKADVKEFPIKVLQVKISELNKEKERLVFSEKEIVDELNRQKREKVFKQVKAGETIEGIISAVMPFGLFVNIEGFEALVPVSEISWRKSTNSVKKIFEIGDKIKAKIIEKEEPDRIILSIKALVRNPWENLSQRYQLGQKVKGKVNRIMSFGAFVEIEKDINGLIHVSETTGPLSVGEEIEAVIINMDAEKQKMGLSVKKLKIKNEKLKIQTKK